MAYASRGLLLLSFVFDIVFSRLAVVESGRLYEASAGARKVGGTLLQSES